MVLEKKFVLPKNLDSAADWDDWDFSLRGMLAQYNMLVHFVAGVAGGPAAILGAAGIQQTYRSIAAAMRESCTGAAEGHLRARTAAGVNIMNMNVVELYLELRDVGLFNVANLDQQLIEARDVTAQQWADPQNPKAEILSFLVGMVSKLLRLPQRYPPDAAGHVHHHVLELLDGWFPSEFAGTVQALQVVEGMQIGGDIRKTCTLRVCFGKSGKRRDAEVVPNTWVRMSTGRNLLLWTFRNFLILTGSRSASHDRANGGCFDEAVGPAREAGEVQDGQWARYAHPGAPG